MNLKHNPLVAASLSLLLLGGGGQIYLGQRKKGILLMVLTVFSFPFGLIIPMISAIDAYVLARIIQADQPLGEWEFFWGRRTAPSVPFWSWFWANTVALSLGLTLGGGCYFSSGFLFYSAPMTAEGSRNAILLGGPIGAVMTGAIIGLFQQIYLRRYLIARSWIFWTVIGSVFGGAFASILTAYMPSSLTTPIISFTLLGTGIGILQWIVLRQQFYRSSLWVVAWVAAGAVIGGIMNTVTIFSSAYSGLKGLMVFAPLFLLFGGILVACAFASAITGIAWVWLLRFSKQTT